MNCFPKILIGVFNTGLVSCSKKGSTPTPPPLVPPVVTDNTTLKEIASYTTGVAISYDLMKNNISYSGLVKKKIDRLTFEYQMKHGANVLNNGSFDFTVWNLTDADSWIVTSLGRVDFPTLFTGGFVKNQHILHLNRAYNREIL